MRNNKKKRWPEQNPANTSFFSIADQKTISMIGFLNFSLNTGVLPLGGVYFYQSIVKDQKKMIQTGIYLVQCTTDKTIPNFCSNI